MHVCLLAALLIALGSQPFAGLAETYVCGTVAGQHWTTNGSPYRITCDVFVALLEIDPGVTVHFESNYVFEVGGFLTAHGTAAAPIIFTRTNGGGWRGILFNYCYDGSMLEHCHISGAVNSGIRCISASPVLRSCVLLNNTTDGEGGGLYTDNRNYPDSEMLVEGCTFTNNTSASHGGGVAARVGTNVIRFVCCTNVGNTANLGRSSGGYVGGGVWLEGNGTFDTCLFKGNAVYAAGHYDQIANGGALYWSGNGSMRNTTIRDNVCQSYSSGWDAYSYGGGAYLDGTVKIQNCIVVFNTASCTGWHSYYVGGGIYHNSGTVNLLNCVIAYNNVDGFGSGGGSATILNSILYFNYSGGTQIVGGPVVGYSCVQGGFTGIGNIVFQPVFGDTNSFMLSLGSRCIDAGDPSAAYSDACDPPSFGPPRGYTWRNDIGAYGGPGACCWECGACTIPIIRSQPQPTTACVGGQATFSVGATGSQPLSYQWRFHGTNATGAPVDISGATNATYTISNVESNHAGYYSVRVSNPLDGTNSAVALLTVMPVCVDIDLYAGLAISGGVPGQSYMILSATNLTPPIVWQTNTSFIQAAGGTLWIDTNSPANKPAKFYLVTP